MKLIKPPVPAEYLWAMRSGLPEFVDPDDAAAAIFLQNHHAYEVFSLDVVKFATTKKLHKSVSSVGWRFMTLDPAGDMGCHVGGSTSPKLLSIARTPDVHIAFHRLRQLEERIQRPTREWEKVTNQPGNFELRGLRIPSMLIEGVWLYPEKANGNGKEVGFFVPCLGFTKARGAGWTWELKVLEPYSPEELLDALGDAPKRRYERQRGLYPELAAAPSPFAAIEAPKPEAAARRAGSR